MPTVSKWEASDRLKFIIDMARAHATVSRTFDRKLEGGIGFAEFVILYHVARSPEERMRRTDLAERLGLTPSGVTRLLLPMEKLGKVVREASEADGRVSYVKLAPGGKRLLEEAFGTAEYVSGELIPEGSERKLSAASDILSGLYSERF